MECQPGADKNSACIDPHVLAAPERKSGGLLSSTVEVHTWDLASGAATTPAAAPASYSTSAPHCRLRLPPPMHASSYMFVYGLFALCVRPFLLFRPTLPFFLCEAPVGNEKTHKKKL